MDADARSGSSDPIGDREETVIPDFSVVTINYNQGEFLQDAIDSLRLQRTNHSWEHIIVDPGSTDNSQAIYDDIRTDTRYTIIEKPDSGPAQGLNRGFSEARGRWFYYLNADDLLLPGALKFAAHFLASNASPSALLGAGIVVDVDGGFVRNIHSIWRSPRDYALGASVAVQQATFFTRDAFELVGGFNEENGICWDGELVVRMAMAGVDVSSAKRALGAFRIYGTSITGSQKFSNRLEQEHKRIAAEILGREARPTDLIEGLARRALNAVASPSTLASRIGYRLRGMSVRNLG